MSIDYVDTPSRPDIDRLIVIPFQTVYFNVSAAPGANVARVVFDADEPTPFTIRYPVD